MRTHMLIAAITALFVSVSDAEAVPNAGLMTAAEQRDARVSLLQPVAYGHRYYSHRYYDRPHYSYGWNRKPWYGRSYGYWAPRHRWYY